MDDAVVVAFDGIGRTNLCTDGIFAMHADLRRSLDAIAPTNRFEVNHRVTAMGVAFFARLYTRLTTNAPRVIDEHCPFVHDFSPFSARRTRTAQILYSGIFDTGSIAFIVHRLAALPSGQ